MIRNCIVFIADDPYDQAVFTRALKDVSPQIICFAVADASDALFIMEQERVIPKYIFVELNLPRMNGLEFLKTIKQKQFLKNIPVIIHAPSLQPHKVIELKEFGALAIYYKPYDYYGVRNMLHLYFTNELLVMQQN